MQYRNVLDKSYPATITDDGGVSVTNAYCCWHADTPGLAIAKMLEFHEGNQGAKGYKERIVEADEIIQDAFKQMTATNTKDIKYDPAPPLPKWVIDWENVKVEEANQLYDRRQIIASVAKWAIRQSPYVVPDNLSQALESLYVLLPGGCDLFNSFYMKPSVLEKLLIVHLESVPSIVAWNKSKNNPTAKIGWCDAYHKKNPDDDFIDLHALARNVQMELTAESRSYNTKEAI